MHCGDLLVMLLWFCLGRGPCCFDGCLSEKMEPSAGGLMGLHLDSAKAQCGLRQQSLILDPHSWVSWSMWHPLSPARDPCQPRPFRDKRFLAHSFVETELLHCRGGPATGAGPLRPSLDEREPTQTPASPDTLMPRRGDLGNRRKKNSSEQQGSSSTFWVESLRVETDQARRSARRPQHLHVPPSHPRLRKGFSPESAHPFPLGPQCITHGILQYIHIASRPDRPRRILWFCGLRFAFRVWLSAAHGMLLGTQGMLRRDGLSSDLVRPGRAEDNCHVTWRNRGVGRGSRSRRPRGRGGAA